MNHDEAMAQIVQAVNAIDAAGVAVFEPGGPTYRAMVALIEEDHARTHAEEHREIVPEAP